MSLNALLHLRYAQHVLGTSMPIIRSSRLYVCYYRLWCAVLGCWLSGARCRAAGCESKQRDAAQIAASLTQVTCHNPSCVILNNQNATYVFIKSSCCSITSRVLLRLQMRLCFVGAYLLWVLTSQNRFICGASAANMIDELASGCTSSEMLCHEPDFSHILNMRRRESYIIQ